MAEFDVTSRLGGRISSPVSVEKSLPKTSGPVGGTQNGGSFIDNLKAALSNVNEAIQKSDQTTQQFTTGRAENLHDVMIAMEKADLSLRTLTAVRGKILDAYHEIMKMPI